MTNIDLSQFAQLLIKSTVFHMFVGRRFVLTEISLCDCVFVDRQSYNKLKILSGSDIVEIAGNSDNWYAFWDLVQRRGERNSMLLMTG